MGGDLLTIYGTLFTGLICASGLFFYGVQLDKSRATAASLAPEERASRRASRRRGPSLGQRLDRVGQRVVRRMTDERRDRIQGQLTLAGNPFGLTPSGYEAVRRASAALLAAVGMVAGIGSGHLTGAAAGGLVGVLAGYFLPELLLNNAAGGRRREIERHLPDAVDLLTLAVEAGLSLDAGMADITVRFHNALGDEFAKALREIRLGKPRLVALEEMGRRSGVAELHNLVQAITQSEQMGIGISRTLRVQAGELRRTRRQISQEAAAQASLRMIFPMVGCIFPTIWIILLGPALLGIVKAWH